MYILISYWKADHFRLVPFKEFDFLIKEITYMYTVEINYDVMVFQNISFCNQTVKHKNNFSDETNNKY